MAHVRIRALWQAEVTVRVLSSPPGPLKVPGLPPSLMHGLESIIPHLQRLRQLLLQPWGLPASPAARSSPEEGLALWEVLLELRFVQALHL